MLNTTSDMKKRHKILKEVIFIYIELKWNCHIHLNANNNCNPDG